MILHQTLIDLRSSLHFACAGAGIEFIRKLWETPGSSRYLIGSSLLQAREEVASFIGYQPDTSYCSKEVSIDLAIAAFIKAASRANPIGIGLTAAIATDRLPRGEQRAHLAIITLRGVFHQEILLEKATGQAARKRHDSLISKALSKLLLTSSGRPTDNDLGLEQLMSRPCFLANGRRKADTYEPAILFPSNFNPAHAGHWEACDEAETLTGKKVHLMIEARPPNKPTIPIPELLRRIAHLRAITDRPVTITFGEGTYLEKSRKRPGSRFVIGADVALRLLEPTWGYAVESMLQEITELNIHFLVRARKVDGVLRTLDEIEIPSLHRNRFIALPGFIDITSRELREIPKP